MQNTLHPKNLTSKTVKSAYIHIPFCKRKCNYCAFTSLPALNLIDDYIKKLTFEIKHYYKDTPLETLYIGGGTPSLLDIKHFEKILSLFKFVKNPEITVEINPDSTSLNLLNGLLKLGVNRLSIGIQSFDDDILKTIGRLHTAKKAKDAICLAQDIGFENISSDLIYGLPNQNMKLWQKDLETLKSLDVQHISLYGLKIEENTPFSKNHSKHLPDDDMQADMYEYAISFLEPEYKLYEISNLAKAPKYSSKHNLNYWNNDEYFGFGLSAAGFLGGIRYQNTKNFMEYIKNPLLSKELTVLSEQEMLEETIFLGFRKMDGLNISKINEKFNIDFDKKFSHVI